MYWLSCGIFDIYIYIYICPSWEQLHSCPQVTLPYYDIVIIIIGIQPLGRSGQRPELSQATSMALVRCILGKFLGVDCHCFPPRLDVPTFATRCPHVRHEARDPSGGRWNCEREYCLVILPKWRLPRQFGIFYMPQIYDVGPTALLLLRRKACWGILRP
jgi:hypothetical protein